MSGNTARTLLALSPIPEPLSRNQSVSGTVEIYGSPFVDDRLLTRAPTAESVLHATSRFARSLNGEFAVFVETSDSVVLINDRFAALPLFYFTDDHGITASFSYTSIWKRLSDLGALKPDRAAFLEFLYFQRLYGERTFDQRSKFLPPASILLFDKRSGQLNLERFWSPSFAKRTDGVKAIAADLADATAASIARKTQDASGVGLLLSGGMDSRLVLAGFRERPQPTCFTIGDSFNNEVDVAGQLAATVGASHEFVRRSGSHYSALLTSSARVGGGMYSFQHGHFFGLDISTTNSNIDLMLHGHGFDYMFQGMYLPSRQIKILGRGTLGYRLSSIDDDPTTRYAQEIKFRLKGVNVYSLINPDLVQHMRSAIQNTIELITSPIRDDAVEKYDLWDYPTVSAPGRHYTYLNVLSANSLVKQRTVAFDNDIFDLYFSVHAEIRYGTKLLAKTTAMLQPALLEVRNANTNLSPELTGTRLAAVGLARSIARRAKINIGGAPGLESTDRSWPTGDELLQSDRQLGDIARQLPGSKSLVGLDLFEMDRIGELIRRFDAGTPGLAATILSLMTIDKFLNIGFAESV